MSSGEDQKPLAAAPETAPDPDEDDLDDLDDMLDEFSAAKLDSTPKTTAAPEASGPGRPVASTEATSSSSFPIAAQPAPPAADVAASLEEDEFAKQLQAGMSEMLRELEANPDMAKQMEELLGQFGVPPPPAAAATGAAATSRAAPAAGPVPPPPPPAQAAGSADDAFQETIRRTMDRMAASSTSADAAAQSAPGAGGDDDFMANLLRELSAGGGPGGAGGEEDFSKMLLGMMEHLTNKEILYEPMKELDDKFPAWLEARKGTLAPEDEERYATQQALVKEIVGRFEREGYSDDNAADREYIVDRMQKMQEAGAPPPDLVGDTQSAQDALNDLDSGCPQQ